MTNTRLLLSACLQLLTEEVLYNSNFNSIITLNNHSFIIIIRNSSIITGCDPIPSPPAAVPELA